MARARRRPKQLDLDRRRWGGRRAGAGRKRARANLGLQAHAERPVFDRHVPVHLTMRVVKGVPRLREQVLAAIVREELARVSQKGFRLLQGSLQDDHLHVIAEADDGTRLSRAMQRLASRVARRVNMLLGRRGKLWKERYHRRDLSTPRQFKNALVYVLMNYRKHAPQAERARRARALDLHSSAIWVDDWTDDALRARLSDERARAGPRWTVDAKTWIARVGWKKHGMLDPRESPRLPG